MTKKLFFLLLGLLSFSFKVSAQDPAWEVTTYTTETETSECSEIAIAQDLQYALASWIEFDGSTYTLYYVYFNGETWSTPVSKDYSNPIANVNVAISTIDEKTIPLIAYTATEDGNLSSVISYFEINSDGTWSQGETTFAAADSPRSLFLGFKGNTAVLSGTTTSNDSFIFINKNVSNLETFSFTRITPTDWGENTLIQDMAMETEKYVFFAVKNISLATNEATDPPYVNGESLFLYKLNTTTEEYTTYSNKNIENYGYNIVANADNNALIFLSYESGFYYAVPESDNTLTYKSVSFDELDLYEIYIQSVDFKGNQVICSFGSNTSTATETWLSYVMTGTYKNGTIEFGEPQVLKYSDSTMSYASVVELVDNYANYIQEEYTPGGSFQGCVKNLAESSDWQYTGELNSTSDSSYNTYLISIADYTGTSDGTLFCISAMGNSGVSENGNNSITINVAILKESEQSTLSLYSSKSKYRFLLQNVYGNKISWDKLENAEYYNVYKDENLSERIYHGQDSYFIDYSCNNSEKTYYVTWINFEGIEQEAQSIVISK